MEQNSVNFRLKLFMESTGLNNSQFADRCEIPRPSFSQVISGRNKKVSNIVLELIHKAFPDLSMMWLMFGEGEMLNNVSDKIDNASKDASISKFSNVRDQFLPFTAPCDDLDDRVKISDSQSDNSDAERAFIPFSEAENNADSGCLKKEDLGVLFEIKNLLAKQSEIKPRKVIRITVFYDDNSYESFGPLGGE